MRVSPRNRQTQVGRVQKYQKTVTPGAINFSSISCSVTEKMVASTCRVGQVKPGSRSSEGRTGSGIHSQEENYGHQGLIVKIYGNIYAGWILGCDTRPRLFFPNFWVRVPVGNSQTRTARFWFLMFVVSSWTSFLNLLVSRCYGKVIFILGTRTKSTDRSSKIWFQLYYLLLLLIGFFSVLIFATIVLAPSYYAQQSQEFR